MTSLNKRKLIVQMKRDARAQSLLKLLQRHSVRLERLTITDKSISFVMTKNNLPKLRAARKKHRAKVKIHYVEPDKILQRDPQTFIGLALLLCMPLLLMQFIWKVDVQLETIELTDAVTTYMQQELPINTPLLKKELPSDHVLRQKIMQQFRDFSWVHITKQGSHLIITPQLAPINEVVETEKPATYLVATNNGVITHFDIERGERLVKPRMTVYKGDILVSGVMGEGEAQTVIGAKGEVYADYWLEALFTVPRVVEYDRLVEQAWQWQWDLSVAQQAIEHRTWRPFLSLVKWEKVQQFERVTERLEEAHIETRLLPLLHEKIVRTLPQKSSIKSENLLHVTIDDDTVKGKVLFFVNENIAAPFPSGKGD